MASQNIGDVVAKVAFVLIDGIGDVSIPALGHKTPLQAAHTPHLDAVAAAGYSGLMDPVEPGLACGSDTAHLSLFGFDPRTYYRGRGAFESMGAGLAMAPGDIAFKCNFATLDESTGIVLQRRADRRFEVLGPLLCAALDGLALPSFPQYSVSVKYATEHRCGVVVRGPGLTDAISATDPLRDNLPLQVASPLDDSPEAAHTAAVVNEVSLEIRHILRAHPINQQRVAEGKPPANVVLLRGCGSRIAVQPFQERHGLHPCMVAPTKIIAGLGMSLGVDVIEVEGATGDYRTQFHLKAEAIAEALTSGGYQFGFLHVKAVDDTGHDRMVDLKVKYNEVVDRMVGQLLRMLWEAEAAGRGRHCLVVTGDHSTPVEFGDHSHEPVPFAIARVADMVVALGGDAAVRAIPLGPIPHPRQQEQQRGALGSTPLARRQEQEEGMGGTAAGDCRLGVASGSGPRQGAAVGPVAILPALAAVQQSLEAASSAEQPVVAAGQAQLQGGLPAGAASCSSGGAQGEGMQETVALGQGAPAGVVAAGAGGGAGAAAVAACGDSVRQFSEIDAAAGALGRFPGSQVMPLIRQFVGLERVVAAGPSG